jgi:hypothetical protein
MSTTPADYLAAAAAAALNGVGTYLRETPEQATLDTSALLPPFLVCGEYTTTQADANSRVSAAAITLYFADVRPFAGDDPAAHQATVARMETLKRRFLTALDGAPVVRLDGLRATPFTGAYAAQLDGVGVQFTLTVPVAALVPACL